MTTRPQWHASSETNRIPGLYRPPSPPSRQPATPAEIVALKRRIRGLQEALSYKEDNDNRMALGLATFELERAERRRPR